LFVQNNEEAKTLTSRARGKGQKKREFLTQTKAPQKKFTGRELDLLVQESRTPPRGGQLTKKSINTLG